MDAHVNAIRDILIKIGERVEGNLLCDIHPDNVQVEQNADKIHNLQTLARGKARICEIGVNAGHSLLLMLAANPTADYVLFDIGEHSYTRACLDYIQTAYPSTRIQIIYGDSKETLPNYRGSFDLIHVDGGHDLPEVMSDYTQSLRLIEAGCPIVFDDSDYPVINNLLQSNIAQGVIQLFQNTERLRPTLRHMIVTPRL